MSPEKRTTVSSDQLTKIASQVADLLRLGAVLTPEDLYQIGYLDGAGFKGSHYLANHLNHIGTLVTHIAEADTTHYEIGGLPVVLTTFDDPRAKSKNRRRVILYADVPDNSALLP